ncbi:ThrRS/AlaRS common domain-containing protein [Collybia nuda]|uniref:ThrRS/AlaRS common domain-containing protein n=1 Tax=Collybia nuda TaxID=64659 RepID=A0A9P5Y5H7_9AGAR|nr:ThrRS/AlaRS common domain-containing protein [Collybia nuda]
MATAVALLPSVTPSDYHRIKSPTLRIPTNPQVSIPVGILACQRDPLLRSLVTFVVSVIVSQPAAPPPKKLTKKAVISPLIPPDPILEVVLHDTVIFPEGGGQPTDTGVIVTADFTTWEVVQVKRLGGHAVHYIRVQGRTVDEALLAFKPGAKVTAALDQNGFERRYDHMSMHTSQHLISALLESRLQIPTLSWSLTSYPSPCYVEVTRGMSLEEITSIQTEANKLVFEGRRVYVEVEELDRDRVKGIQKLESGRSVGKALPDDYTGGVNRVVIIDGVDKNPCCGTHLPSIHNLQLFLLPHTEALSRSSTSSARLYFLCGPRLITHLTSTHNLLTSTASTLNCGTPLVPDRVNQVVEERKKAEKRVSELEAELAGSVAKSLVGEMKELAGHTLFKKHIHRIDDTGNALGFASAVSHAFSNLEEAAVIPHLVVITSSPPAQMPSSATIILAFGSDEGRIKQATEALKGRLNVKGGGKGLRWSGKFFGVWKDDREGILLEEVLNEL